MNSLVFYLAFILFQIACFNATVRDFAQSILFVDVTECDHTAGLHTLITVGAP